MRESGHPEKEEKESRYSNTKRRKVGAQKKGKSSHQRLEKESAILDRNGRKATTMKNKSENRRAETQREITDPET